MCCRDGKRNYCLKPGGEVLIKAVIQVIPTYAMGCFKLPVGLCDKIKGLIRRFWWGNGGDKRKVNWLNWKKA